MAPSVEASDIWIYFIPLLFIFYYYQQVSRLNDASVDIRDDEDSFQFSPEAEFTSHLYVHVIFATDTEAELTCNCYSVKNVLKLLAFKWLLTSYCLKQNDQRSC